MIAALCGPLSNGDSPSSACLLGYVQSDFMTVSLEQFVQPDRTGDFIVRCACTVFALTLVVRACCGATAGAETAGQVTQVQGETLVVTLVPGVTLSEGDRVEVFVELPGVGDAQVATATVIAVAGNSATAKLQQATGKVEPGQKVRRLAAAPAVPVASPSPRRSPGLPAIHWSSRMDSTDPFANWIKQVDYYAWSGGVLEVRYRQGDEPLRDKLCYPVILSDAGIRANVKKGSGQNIFFLLRHSERGNYSAWYNGGDSFGINQRLGDNGSPLATIHTHRQYPDFFLFEFMAVGDKLTLSVNGETILERNDSAHREGWIALGARSGGGLFRNIEIFTFGK